MADARVASEWRLLQAGRPGQRPAGQGPLKDLEERERALRIRPGAPILLRPDGSADLDVLNYLTSPSFRHLSSGSQLGYAQNLRVHFSHLWSQGLDWRDATEDHLGDYSVWRQDDERNPRRVTGTAFARELAAIRRFYEWQERRGTISQSPVEVRTVQRGRDVVEVARLQPPAGRSVRMTWMTPRAFRQWVDVGLSGYRVNDTYDASWRGGGTAARNIAFAELLWSSGLRLREAATLLLAELPSAESGRYPKARLSAAVAKGAARDYWVSQRALTAIRSYAMASRAAAVRRAQEAGRYDMPGVMVQLGITSSRQLLFRDRDSGGEGRIPLDSLGVSERHRLFVEGEDGIEPAMVWLSEAGLPLAHKSWQKVFERANRRCAAAGLPDRTCHPHALRHSFALMWLCVFKYAHELRFGLTPQERDVMRRRHSDPYTMVSQLLGHSSRETTEHIYLAPVRGLEVELWLDESAGEMESPSDLMALAVALSGRIQDVDR